MANNKFSVFDAVKYGFYTVIEKILFFLGIELFLFCVFASSCVLIIGIFGFLSNIPFNDMFGKMILSSSQEVITLVKERLLRYEGGLPILILLLGGIIVIYDFMYHYFLVGIVRISLDIYDQETSSYKRLFGPISIVIKMIFASILYCILVTLGTICLIIPGVIISIRCSLYPQFLVYKNFGIIESLKESARITKGSFFKLFGISIIYGICNGLAFLTFGLIYIITYPAFYLTQAYVYRKLLAAA